MAFGYPKGYDNYSFASGKKKGGLLAGWRKNQAAKNKQKALDSANTKLAIKALNKPDAKIKLPALPKESKGMSKTAKIAIGVGIGLVVLIGGYFAYKKFGKHGK